MALTINDKYWLMLDGKPYFAGIPTFKFIKDVATKIQYNQELLANNGKSDADNNSAFTLLELQLCVSLLNLNERNEPLNVDFLCEKADRGNDYKNFDDFFYHVRIFNMVNVENVSKEKAEKIISGDEPVQGGEGMSVAEFHDSIIDMYNETMKNSFNPTATMATLDNMPIDEFISMNKFSDSQVPENTSDIEFMKKNHLSLDDLLKK